MAIPRDLIAGDLWAIRVSEPRYVESDGFATELMFALGTVRLTAAGATGEAEGEWIFIFPSSETENAKPPGTWAWAMLATKAGDRFTAQSGTVQILPNPAEAGPVEPKSIKRRTLEAAWETRLLVVSSPVSVAMFQGHAYTLHDLEKLDRIIRKLEDEVGGEDGGGPGAGSRKTVYLRFVRA